LLYELIHENNTRSVINVGTTTLRAGIISPYNTVIQYQQWISSLTFATAAPPRTIVSNDGLNITYGNVTLNVPVWRGGLALMHKELELELEELCYGSSYGLSLPEIIEDNWSEDKYGYSWLDKETSYLEDKWGLLQNLLGDSSLGLATLTTGGKLVWNRLALTNFLRKSNAFMSKLGFFGFATNGQVARISEYVEHKIRNSYRPRTIFCNGPDMWMVIRRSKFETLVKSPDFRPMKCHPSFTLLLQRYLLIVRPIEVIFASVLYGPSVAEEYRQFMFMQLGERISSDRYLQYIQSTTLKYFKVPIGAREYRQLTVEIGRVYIGSTFNIDSDDSDVLALQRGHSASMARRKYAPEVDHLPSMSSDRLLEFGHASEAWWEVTGFRPGYPPMMPFKQRLHRHIPNTSSHQESSAPGVPSSDTLSLVLNYMKQMEANISNQIQALQHNIAREVQTVVAEALAMQSMAQSNVPQSTHPAPFSISTLSNFPTIPTMPIQPLSSLPVPTTPPLLPDHSLSHRSSSELSYASLILQPMDIEEEEDFPDIAKGEQTPVHQLSRRVRSSVPFTGGATWATKYDMDEQESKFLHQCLKKHFPTVPRPTFRTETQALAVALVIQRSASFVVHLPTGMGKSLTYQIASRLPEGKTNIVVIPNAFLLREQVQKAQDMGLKAIHWSASQPFPTPATANLVFMALESVLSNTFKR
jgi:hypothetical protein